MGLAASQARLLLLTARKSDLEYRAQQITNSEMILAMQTEQIAREYSIKISNQALFYTNGLDAAQATKCLKGSSFELVEELLGTFILQEKDDDGNWHKWVANSSVSAPEVLYTYTADDGVKETITESDYNSLPQDEKDKCVRQTTKDANGNEIPVTKTYPQTNKEDISPLQLLEGIKNGTLRIVNAAGEIIDLNGNNGFTQSYYTDDDRKAEAEYEQKTASIQVKEKRLQNDLNQVETQQKACDTEIDSVKKVMEKNIERTFKVFS